MPVISGHHNGHQIFIDVVLLDFQRDMPDFDNVSRTSINLEPVRALVDTGATATSITPGVSSRLGLRMAGQRSVLTAGGPTFVPYFFFKVGFVYPEHVEPVSRPAEFHVLPAAVVGSTFLFQDSPFDILLGMDVISQGDLIIRRDGSFRFEF